MTLEAIRYSNGKLEILDQLLLPHESKYIPVKDTNDGWQVIKKMQVRGAPAIGVVGSLSLVVELYNKSFSSCAELVDYVKEKLDYLVTSRPTAVNMNESRERFSALVKKLASEPNAQPDGVKKSLIKVMEGLQDEDINTNKTMSNFGAEHILKNYKSENVKILTHCNTGSLATAGYGTALGVVRALRDKNKLEHCFCSETRPYNQGSRLTAYELMFEKIPSTLICDSMASMLMRDKGVTAVAVGADRVVANGDTANKIGTYQLAIVAKYHKVPFYVVAPSTSIDLTLDTGSQIVIEERPAVEMTTVKGVSLAPEGMNCWNPAFDVTPADLITGGIVTEFGVFTPAELKSKLQDCLANKQN